MAQGRIIYWADWDYVDKQLKEFTLTQEVIEKLDSIEPGAERNYIQWIKVNWEIQTPDQYRVVDLSIPEVEDTLSSYDNTAALSARQWRVLYNYIRDLQQVWHFLSNWNCSTWLPQTNPQINPYVYNTWDYFIVSNVSSWTNYKPNWSQYITWQASTTVEQDEVKVWDFYVYDWTNWLLLLNTERAIAIDTSLSTASTNPVENRVVTQALNGKQSTLTAWTNITINWDTISATDTTYNSLPAAQGWTDVSLVTTWDKYDWNNKQDALTAWANIQINNWVISATDTIYWAWTNVQISAQNIISATDTTYTASDFDIKDLTDSTNLRATWSGKQDSLTPWSNIQINWSTISATDTTYSASDFDIKDLTDSTNLRTTWSGKQDALTSQTAYTSKWTSTKVPTITTNTLWQVTGISETSIAFPVTSVNGNTWAVVLSIPSTASDVWALADTTKYWASLVLSIDSSTYVITATLKDQDGNTLGTSQTIDLPLESVVVSGSYDSTNKKVILTLKDGSTIDFSVADLISWLQTEINSSNKLNADYVDDTSSTHKFVTASDKSTWNWKQDALTTQTAYTSKGSATKVPQITTNSLWQVTGITEVTITQPDISWKQDTLTAWTNIQINWTTISATDTTYSTATSSTVWLVKLWSDTVQSVAANAPSSTASRTYPVQLNSSNQAVVNVPWSDTTVSSATSSTAGTVKLASDTTQTVAANTITSTVSRTYGVQTNSSWQMVVNVPWTDNNTTYSQVSKNDMDTWTSTTAGVVSAKDISDFVAWKISGGVNYKWQVADYASLPASPTAWDMYNVVAAHTTAPKFDAWTNVVWSGSAWDPMAEMVDLSNLVDKTTAQTVGWVKTFTSEPVLPSKTTDATNSWTKPATEAQVYKKQDKLTAWTNIIISWNTISATDTTYTAWTWLSLTWTEFSNAWVLSVNGSTWNVTVQPTLTAWNLIWLTSNVVKNKALFVIKESDVTVTTDDTKWVAPYNTSYGYTDITINNSDVEWVEWALYTFIVDTTMVVASANRNVRVRIGTGSYIPVMNTSAILAWSSYFIKATIRYFQYTTKYQSWWALHMVTDSNTTYSSMTAAEITAGTWTTARLITPANLKTAIQTWEHWNVFVTQTQYDDLPSSKTTDWNTYIIYKT